MLVFLVLVVVTYLTLTVADHLLLRLPGRERMAAKDW